MKVKETKRAQQARETKERIYYAAMELFNEHGIESVSIADIAEAAQCSPGNIYHYFKGKEDIALQTICPLDEEYTEFYQMMQECEPYCNMDAAGQLEEFFCEVIRICSIGKTLQSSYVLALKNPSVKVLQQTDKRDYYQICTKLLERMETEGSLASDFSIEMARDLLLVLLRGILVEWIISERAFDPVKRARLTMRVMLAGFSSR